MIAAEWVETIATGIPVYTGAGLVLWGQGWLWRKWLWDHHGEDLRAIEAEVGGKLSPLWTGWSIQGRDVRVRVEGGLRGVKTRVRRAGKTVEHDGVVTGVF